MGFVLVAAFCTAFPVDDIIYDHRPSKWLSSYSLMDHGFGVQTADQDRIRFTPSGEGQGWLARWLSMGGEGSVTVCVSGSTIQAHPILLQMLP